MIGRITLFTLLLCAQVNTWAQLRIAITQTPQLTGILDSIYIAGSFNDWKKGEEQYKLLTDDNGLLYVNIPAKYGTKLSFLFYKKNHFQNIYVPEGDEKGIELKPRQWTHTAEEAIEVTVESWTDLGVQHTVTPEVRILTQSFFSAALNAYRRVWIYIPASYATAEYPMSVLYMHDGQNLFDQKTSFAGEWNVDETLQTFANTLCQEMIVVGIDNGGAERINELAPWRNEAYNGGGKGEAYAQFIINELKPAIDANFITDPSREATYTAGSSLGGLMSAYLVLKHGDVFSRAGIFSPAFWFNQSELLELISTQEKNDFSNIYMTAGEQESEKMIKDMVLFRDQMEGKGYETGDIQIHAVTNAEHNEKNWSQQFPAFFEWLAYCSPAENEGYRSCEWVCYPYWVEKNINARLYGNLPLFRMEIKNEAGEVVFTRDVKTDGDMPYDLRENWDVSTLATGTYTMNLIGNDGIIESKTFQKK